jgi:hypothetical protein
MWDIRNRGVIPPGALPRVRAFADAVEVGSDTAAEAEAEAEGRTDQDSGEGDS